MGECANWEERKEGKALQGHFMKMHLGSKLTQLAYNDASWLDLSPCAVALTGIFFYTIMSVCHGMEEGEEF